MAPCAQALWQPFCRRHELNSAYDEAHFTYDSDAHAMEAFPEDYCVLAPLTIRSALYPLIGKRVHGPIGSAVDIAAIAMPTCDR